MKEKNAAKQRRYYLRKQAIVIAWKAARGCARCGERDVRCLDAHHRDPDEKNPKLRNGLAKTRAMHRLSYAELETELAKCECLCANCHRKEHHPSTKEK